MDILRRLYEHPFLRFAAVGAVATGINYATYTLLVLQFEELIPEAAYVGAFCVSIVCNFLLSSYFTFDVRPTWTRAGKFLAAHLINLVNELILLRLWLWLGVPKLFAPPCVFLVAFPVNYFLVRFALRGRRTMPE
ncbi:MAG: GtrA family protein [Alistipes sp.]|nr:GtrA family protein [Alistipes sp.]